LKGHGMPVQNIGGDPIGSKEIHGAFIMIQCAGLNGILLASFL
jgi:hypothetical protein